MAAENCQEWVQDKFIVTNAGIINHTPLRQLLSDMQCAMDYGVSGEEADQAPCSC